MTITNAATNCMLLNPEPPKLLGETAAIDVSDMEPCFLKYVRYEEALDIVHPSIRHVLLQMSRGLQHKHRFTLVDVKIRDLAPGDYGCIPGWHIDSVSDPRHDSTPENHLIWIQGTPTEFPLVPVEFPNELTHFSQVTNSIPDDNIMKIKPNTIYQYGRYHLHRGPKVVCNERRVLIRITETDVVNPNPHRK